MNLNLLLGKPPPTKKPSTLRRSRSPPVPVHIDKQKAISIARKLKLTHIGKVTLRSTAKQNYDDNEARVVGSETRMRVTRKLLIDKKKGIETARIAKDSAIGQCILETNEYASRKLLVDQDKIIEERERRSKMLTQKKREFKTKCDLSESIRRDNKCHSLPLVNTDSHTAKSNPIKSTNSPNYMRPLSCHRWRSDETAVAETERFLRSPFMRAVLAEEMEKLLAAKSRETELKKSNEKNADQTEAKSHSADISIKNTDISKMTPPSMSDKSLSPKLRLMRSLMLPFLEKDYSMQIHLQSSVSNGEGGRDKVTCRQDITTPENDDGFNTLRYFPERSNRGKLKITDKVRKEWQRKAEPNFTKEDRRFVDLDKNPAYKDERFRMLVSSLIPDSSGARNLYYDADIDGGEDRLRTPDIFGIMITPKKSYGRYRENMVRFEQIVRNQKRNNDWT